MRRVAWDLIEPKHNHGIDEAIHEPDRHHRKIGFWLRRRLRAVRFRVDFAQRRGHGRTNLDKAMTF